MQGTGPRPHWDAYDSWAGMLPFNRDRIYQHARVNGRNEESVEAAAIRRIFKSLKDDPLYRELTLPNGITQDATTAPPASSDETLKIALYRLYLEPLGVAVDTWSMSVRRFSNTTGRNRTYTFGDLFSSPFGFYIKEIDARLRDSLRLPAAPAALKCGDLAANSIRQYVRY